MWPSKIILFLLVGAIASLAAVGEAQAEESETESSSDEPSKPKKIGHIDTIEASDRVLIKIYPEDQYIKGGEMSVSSEGTITLPLLGKVKIQGLKISEAEEQLAALLAKDYLVNPVVVIEVTRLAEEELGLPKRTLSILGQVQKPGSYDIPGEGRLTLLKLISTAGGFTDVANVKKIKVIRKKDGDTSILRANAESIIAGKSADIELQEEDVIHVGESLF